MLPGSVPLPYRGVNFKSSLEGEFHIVSYTIGVLIIFGTFAFIGLAALRSVGRLWVVMTSAGRKGDHRVLIIGAGDAGPLLPMLPVRTGNSDRARPLRSPLYH